MRLKHFLHSFSSIFFSNKVSFGFEAFFVSIIIKQSLIMTTMPTDGNQNPIPVLKPQALQSSIAKTAVTDQSASITLPGTQKAILISCDVDLLCALDTNATGNADGNVFAHAGGTAFAYAAENITRLHFKATDTGATGNLVLTVLGG